MDLSNVRKLQGLQYKQERNAAKGSVTTVTTTCIFASCASQNC